MFTQLSNIWSNSTFLTTFFERGYAETGRVETAVVVGMMRLVVRWKDKVLAHLLRRYYTLAEGLRRCSK